MFVGRSGRKPPGVEVFFFPDENVGLGQVNKEQVELSPSLEWTDSDTDTDSDFCIVEHEAGSATLVSLQLLYYKIYSTAFQEFTYLCPHSAFGSSCTFFIGAHYLLNYYVKLNVNIMSNKCVSSDFINNKYGICHLV